MLAAARNVAHSVDKPSEDVDERKEEKVLVQQDSGIKCMDGEDTMNGIDFDGVYMLSKKVRERLLSSSHPPTHPPTHSPTYLPTHQPTHP